MAGSVSGEVEVNAPASMVWELYRSLELLTVTRKALDKIVDKIEVLEGDGSVGTLLQFYFHPGAVPFSYYKEKFTKVDDEKMVKVVEVVEGGFLDLGFKWYLVRLDVIAKDEKSCITRNTIEYELKEDADPKLASVVSIDPLMAMMNIAANHLVSGIKA
ncbi:norbelladine synthase-like [Apium graveolens]|uniref:norbelladine synthase-like n=1 Tax=Apium graveolens TaxID=4045 RepID=UPI003D7A5C59